MLWKSKGRRRRASHPTAESSSEQGASEADIDSDSGYCSPKHSNNQPAAGTVRNPDSGTVNVCGIVLISLLVIDISIIILHPLLKLKYLFSLTITIVIGSLQMYFVFY